MVTLKNIIVCVKIVPRPEDIRYDPTTKTVDRSKALNIINPADKNALELALQLKEAYGGNVIALSMGPLFWIDYLKLVAAMGVDKVILISDKALAGSDTLPTSLTLAKAIEKIGNYDLVLCGEYSSDGATSQVPPGIAEWLELPHVTYVSKIEITQERKAIVTRVLPKYVEILEVPLPFLASVELGCNIPRFPDFSIKKKLDKEFEVTIWTLKDLGLKQEEVGFQGSTTSVISFEELKPPERMKVIIRKEELRDRIDEIINILI